MGEFNTFCEQNEIVKQLTTVETPHYNGVTKRKNKIILERARCMAIEENVYQNTFGLRLKLTQLHISQTKIPRFPTMGCRKNMVIMARYQTSTTWKYLVILHMFTYQRQREVKWNPNPFNT